MTRARRWLTAALFLAPAPLSYFPGLPPHGYGHMLFLLPLLSLLANPRLLRRFALYLGVIVLQALAFPTPDLGFLGFAILLPYLLSRDCEDGATWWRVALLFGFFRSFAGFVWIGDVHYTAWVGVSLAAALAFACVFEATVRFATFLPFAFRVAVGWTLFEWVHSWFIGGFPWLFLAYTQHRFLALVQVADLTGTYGVSFLVAFVQAAAFYAWRARHPWALAAPVALSAAAIVYGGIRLAGAPEAPPGKSVLLLQSALHVSVKEDSRDALETTYRGLLHMTERGLAAHPETDLVVWPETLFPHTYVENDPTDPYGFVREVGAIANWIRRPAIYGVTSLPVHSSAAARRGHNSAVLVTAQGRFGGIYRKQRLVPMGELFLPRLVLPERFCDAWMRWLVEGPLRFPPQCDLEWGESHVTLDAGPGLRCAMLICFEGLYPGMARAALCAGERDLLLHLANHGWFSGSLAQAQARPIWVFRAIETRAPFLSCANAGVTCAVAPTGEVLGSLDETSEAGFLSVRVPPRWSAPPYLSMGPWMLPVALSLLSGAFFLRRRAGPPRKSGEGGGGRKPGP